MIVIYELISFDNRRDGLSLLVIAVTVILHDIVFQQDFCRADAHHVSDRDSAAVPCSIHRINLVSDDTNRIIATRSQVDLRTVDAINICVELAIQYLR